MQSRLHCFTSFVLFDSFFTHLEGHPWCKNLWSFSLFSNYNFPWLYCWLLTGFFVWIVSRHSWGSQVFVPNIYEPTLINVWHYNVVASKDDALHFGQMTVMRWEQAVKSFVSYFSVIVGRLCSQPGLFPV